MHSNQCCPKRVVLTLVFMVQKVPFVFSNNNTLKKTFDMAQRVDDLITVKVNRGMRRRINGFSTV